MKNKKIKAVMMISFAVCLLYPGGVFSSNCVFVTIPQEIVFPEGWNSGLQFDPNNPQEINPGGTILLNLLDGAPPFSWQVSGQGYSLSSDQTNGRGNTLICSGGT